MSRRRTKPNPNKDTKSTVSKETSRSPSTSDISHGKDGDDKDLENNEGKNDPEWYARDPQLLLDGANIPYNIPFGASLKHFEGSSPFPEAANVAISDSYTNKSIPGICSLVLKPSVGYSMKKTDPLNVCANAFYTHIRYVNSGRKNYDPADLMMYALIFGDLYSFLIWAERIYCYAFMYSQRNWYIGKAMIQANGVDPQDIILNLANFRYWINSTINKLSSFCLPGDIYYFKRRAFLYQNYYLENPNGNIKDQLYQLVPEGWYKFDFNQDTGAGKLKYVRFRPTDTSLKTMSDIVSYFNTLMENITGDEDFGLMSGDVLKAYGSNIIGLAQMGEEAMLAPVYDPYVLSQFKNANIWGQLLRGNPDAVYDIADVDYVYGDVEQTPSGLIICQEKLDESDARFTYFAFEMAARKILTTENPSPGVGDTIEGTRLTVSSKDNMLNPGTEIPTSVEFTEFDESSGTFMSGFTTEQNMFIDSPSLTLSAARMWMNYIRVFNNFKYAPLAIHMVLSEAYDVTYIERYNVLGNLDNTTLLTNDMLNRIHEIALLSLFYVPGVAKLLS